MNMIWGFLKFYIGQLFHKAWFLLGFLPAVADMGSLWLGTNFTSSSIFRFVTDFKWVFLGGSIVYVHISMLYRLWIQPSTDPVQLPTEEADLSYRQKEIAASIEKTLSKNDIVSSFTTRYRNGYKHRNNSTSTAAREFCAAFSQTKMTFLSLPTYDNGSPPENLLATFRSKFEELESFSGEAKNDANELNDIILGLENSIGSLLAYINV